MQFYYLTCVRGGALGRARTHKHTSAYIPYLDNIEITLMKIFVKSTEISGKIAIFFLNGLLSLINSTLNCDRILKVIHNGVKYPRERGSLLENIINTHREVYLG